MNKDDLYKRSLAVVDLYEKSDWYKQQKLKPYRPFGKWETYSIENNQGATVSIDDKLLFFVTGSNEWADWMLNIKRFRTQVNKTKTTPKGEIGKVMDKYLSPDMKRKIINCIPEGVRFHDGFFIGAIKLLPYYLECIKDKKQVEIITHSYGSGVGTILAFLTQILYINDEIDCKVSHVQPESSPRVGNKSFALCYNMLLMFVTYRIFKDGDIVCKVPFFGYHHIETEYRLGKLKWWQIISKWFGLPGWHYPTLLPPLIKKEIK